MIRIICFQTVITVTDYAARALSRPVTTGQGASRAIPTTMPLPQAPNCLSRTNATRPMPSAAQTRVTAQAGGCITPGMTSLQRLTI